MLKAYFILFLKSIEERQIISFLRTEQSEGGKWSGVQQLAVSLRKLYQPWRIDALLLLAILT